jgi:uncharacterized protein YndB with AHSA1/START domain
MSPTDGPAVAVVTRVLPARPGVVFDEWLDPEALREWMCPRPARVVGVEIDPTVGGALRLDIDDGGSRSVVTGEFLALDRPRRLVFTWRDSNWAETDPDSVVTVLLEPHGNDATEMRILHESLPPGALQSYGPGWDLVARQLETSLASRSHP